jgi:hypothetical protein
MIRKNAVESILAERDILITVRNPFVVCQLAEIRYLTIFLCLTLYTKHFIFDLLPFSIGAFLLFIYISRKPVPCNGVFEWR